MAECFEAAAEAFGFACRVGAFVPPVGSEIDVVALVGVHMPDGDHDRVRDRGKCFLFGGRSSESPELCGQPCVLGAGRGP